MKGEKPVNVLEWVFDGELLSHRVTVYVPSTRNVDQQLTLDEAEELVQRTAKFLSKLFGGATAQPAVGFWVDGENLVRENVTLVYAYTRRLSKGTRKSVLDYCESLKVEYGQQAVAVEFDGKLRFV